MNFKNSLAVILLAASTALFAPGCKSKPKDADIKANVETAIANPAITVDVKEVKAVTNAINVTPAVVPQAPVVISEDSTLVSGVNSIMKNYKGINKKTSQYSISIKPTVNNMK